MGSWCLVACSMAALVLSASLLSASLSSSSEKQPVLSVEEVLSLGDELEFAAIQAIHSQLDDNDDGKVDLSESEEFVQTELCGGSGGQRLCFSSEKSQRFHETDKHITSMELWMAWHTNEVFNWTTDDVVFWLTNHVHLPQYAEVFRRHKITGRLLPKVATNSGQILQSVLLISDSQHRQKIQLRAMDAILFGPPRTSGYWKDIIMTLSILLCAWGVLYALRQRWIAQSRIDSFLEDCRQKEEELTKLRSKLEIQEMAIAEETDSGKGESSESPPNGLAQGDPLSEDLLSEVSYSRSSSMQADPESSLYRAHEEIESLHRKVLSLESQLETNHSNVGLLQSLLQESCKREWEHLEVRKKMAEEQMTRAEKVCDKIKKRRSSLFGSLHLANSSALEDAGLQITKAVNNMQTISECFDEYHKRWRRVEHICGFQVCSSPSSPTHNHAHSSAHSHKYEPSLYLSTGSDSSGNSLSTLDGFSLRQGALLGGDAPVHLHRSSTLPRFCSNSFSLSDSDSLYYHKSRTSSISSSSTSTSCGTPAFLKSLKSPPPFGRQLSAEVGDVDSADGCQQVMAGQYAPQIHHHQLHHASVGSPSCKRLEADITELSESPKHVRRKLRGSSSVPALLTRKDSYSEAIYNGEEGGGPGVAADGELSGGITFLVSSASSVVNPSTATITTKALPSQQQTPNQSTLKPAGHRAAALNGLEAIREERVSQLSLNSSGSSETSGQGPSDGRAGSSSPDKPKGKGRSQSPRVGSKSASAINHRAISSDV